MVIDISGARQRLTGRLQRPHREDGERGSLILDILIGMAIFALIAIIAVSAIGQYRERAYTQTAVSDAEATALAIQGYITDNASEGTTYPTGVLNDSALTSLGVSRTEGAGPSRIVVTPAVNVEDFEVCVEHKSAYALYDTAAGGLQESGSMERDGFEGCGTGSDEDEDEDDASAEGCSFPSPAPAIYYSDRPQNASNYPQAVHDAGLRQSEMFVPSQIPGLTREAWEATEGRNPWEGFPSEWLDSRFSLPSYWDEEPDVIAGLRPNPDEGTVVYADGSPYLWTVHLSPAGCEAFRIG